MTEPSSALACVYPTPLGPVGVVDEGQGPALLLVHGMPGSVRDFRWLTPHLVGRFRCVRVDLAGFGATPAQSGVGHTPEAHARLLLAALDALNLESVIAVGHSVGGAVALALAANEPRRVVALAMLAAPGLRPHRAWRRAFPVQAAWLLRQPLLGRAVMPLARWAFVASGFPRSTSRAAVYEAFQTAGHVDFSRQRALLAGVAQPVLVGWAEDDHLVEPAVPQEMADAANAESRLVFATGGHNIQKTRAAEIAAALLGWQTL